MMKNALMWCFLGLITCTPFAHSQSSSPEQTVAALEQQWLQGQKTNNPALIEPLLAEKFIETLSDGGVIDRAVAMKMTNAMKYTLAVNEDVKVTVFGDAAVATGGFRGKGIDSAGKPFDDHERWTDTWIKMPNGKWQCVATQATPIKM